MNRRLYRSRTDSVIGGVAGGVAQYLDVDPAIVRIVWAILGLVTGGIFVILYIVMWIAVPETPEGMPMPGPGAMPGWQGPSSQPATEGETGGGAMPAGDDQPTAPTATPGGYAGGYAAGHSWGHDSARRRGSGGAMIFGLILVALGAWFLVDEYLPGIDSDLLWPIGLVILGIALLFVSMRRSSQ